MPSPLRLCPGERLSRIVFFRSCTIPSRVSPKIPFLASLLLAIICISCGAVGSDPPPPAAVVNVTPASARPYQGETVQFQAAVQNSPSSAVDWQVQQIAGGNTKVGTIDSTGLYTAPAQVPNPPTVAVTAVLQSDASKSGSASVTVQALSSIQGLAISPQLSSVTLMQQIQYNVLTSGVANTEVNWSVDSVANGNATIGTISAAGAYLAPSAAGAHVITAVLQANPGAIASANVKVTDFPGTLTWRNDNSRSGVNSKELVLAPGTVNFSSFGKLFSCPIDGYAYAQPLYVPNLTIAGIGTHNVVLVATEKDSIFAFDADASPCLRLWQTSLIPPGSQAIETPNLQIANTDIVPFVGITGTPVIGGSTPTLYAVAASQTIAANPAYSVQLHALDLTTVPAAVAPPGVEIAVPAGQSAVFNAMVENQRPALLLDNGTVYVGFGSYGGLGDYHGWLFAYQADSLVPTGFFDVTPGLTLGGIWQSGGGPSADANHNVYVATGDGRPNQGINYSDSILRMNTSAGLSVADYFTPCDQGLGWGTNPNAVLESMSSAPLLLPDSAGSATEPHLLIGGSKEGNLYVVNRDAMGGFDPGPCPDAATRVQTISTGTGPILSTPLFWNNFVFVAPGSGNLTVFPMTAGILAASPSALSTQETLGPQGATPVISANGTDNAILWLIDTSGALATPANTPAVLRAYDPNNLSNEIYNSTIAAGSRDQAGLAVKFTVPTVANGKVYVGTQTELDVYGLLP
jgi:hypothetical protein